MNAGRPLLVIVAALSVLSCRSETQSSRPAARPTEDAGLRPMTSRDDAAPPAGAMTDPHGHAADPKAAGSLPAGHPPVVDTTPAMPAAGQGGSIRGTIDVAPALKGKIQGGALFVIARHSKSRQIVAVRKMDEATLPQKFDLSGAHAMVAGTAFEGPLNVTARWSQRGDAMPQPGDIEGTVTDVAVGATGVKVVLTETRK